MGTPLKSRTKRIIFHVDLDAFFTSVEEVENPALKGKPLIVGGRPDKRGVVAAANYAARAFKVRSAMTTAQALRRCPKAIIIPPQHNLYRKYSEQVMAILRQASPVLEQLSIDEAFLDMSARIPDAFTPLEYARQLQKRIKTELQLSASIGIAGNKLVAKIASDFDKPGGLTTVPPGAEAAFLSLLPIRELWGVGPKTAEGLAQLGVVTIGDLARQSEAELVRLFGINGAAMWRRAQGIDNRPLKTVRVAKSISQETTFAQDVDDPQILGDTLRSMSAQLSRRLQKKGFTARTVTLKLRYSDFSTLTRNATHDPATHHTDDIYRQARYLLQTHWNSARPLRLIGLGVSNFVEGVEQLPLF
ncbi:MAG TPA: DNA polymerase IV [Chloroflexi bacterium]|nr:DNA polymerase IV [Chloroflexota bacterium]